EERLREETRTVARLYEAEHRSRELAERAQLRLAVLADASRVLAASLDVDRILPDLIDVVAPALADGCVVFLAGDDGRLRPVVAARDGDAVPHAAVITATDPDDPVARCFRTGASVLLSPAPEPGDAGAGVGSVIVVALVGRKGPLGALTLRTTEGSSRVFT